MAEDVKITYTANDKDLIDAYRKRNDRLEKELQTHKRVNDESKRGGDQQKNSLEAIATKTLAVVGGYDAIVSAVQAVVAEQDRMLRQAGELTSTYDEMFRKFQIQAGMTDLQRKEAQAKILDRSAQFGFNAQQGSAIATQLVSSGFSSDEATGGSLEAMMQTLVATNQSGKDVDTQGLTLAMAQFMAANGMEKNEANIRDIGPKLFSLFQGTNLQLSGLTDLAGVSSAISGQLSMEEQFAATSALVDSDVANRSAIGLRNFVGILGGASESTPRKEALEKMGLTAGDVDFVGEDLQSVLGRLQGGVESLPEEQRKGVMQKLFGREGESFANALISRQGAISTAMQLQQDTGGFQEAVRVGTSGVNVAANRQQMAQESQLLKMDDGGSLVRQEMEIVGGQLDGRGFGGTARRVAEQRAFDLLRANLGAETATDVATGAVGGVIGGFKNMVPGYRAAEMLFSDPQITSGQRSDIIQGVTELRQTPGGAGEITRMIDQAAPDGVTSAEANEILQRMNELLEQVADNTDPSQPSKVQVEEPATVKTKKSSKALED